MLKRSAQAFEENISSILYPELTRGGGLGALISRCGEQMQF